MEVADRRNKIAEILNRADGPTSGSLLAKQLNVSRQIVVGDIALLRASGYEIMSTPRGYIMTVKESSGAIVKTIACNHKKNDMAKEIYTIVDNGGAILDVTVEHSLYGQISGPIHIFSRYDASEFIRKVHDNSSSLLLNLTEGTHLHTISCNSEVILNRVLLALEEKGLLAK